MAPTLITEIVLVAVPTALPAVLRLLIVACQRDGTTVLPRAWDHLEVLSSMTVLVSGVNGDAPTLPVGGAFDDEGVRP